MNSIDEHIDDDTSFLSIVDHDYEDGAGDNFMMLNVNKNVEMIKFVDIALHKLILPNHCETC